MGYVTNPHGPFVYTHGCYRTLINIILWFEIQPLNMVNENYLREG